MHRIMMTPAPHSPPHASRLQRRTRSLIPFTVALVLARMAGWASRLVGRGGTSLPGKLLLHMRHDAIHRLAARLDAHQVVLVSATNGKTTVCAMLATVFESCSLHVVHNMTGANLRSGVATTLMRAPRQCDVLLLEIDEATLPLVAAELTPDVLVLGNLFRDQLDRYGELDTIANRWITMLDDPRLSGLSLVYNADDPLVAHIADTALEASRGTISTVPFAMDDASVAREGMPHAADSRFCARCASPLSFRVSWIGHLGDWSCPSCNRSRPTDGVRASTITLDGVASSRILLTRRQGERITPFDEIVIRVPGLYNAYNALAAAAAACAAGITPSKVSVGLTSFSPAFGRFERIPVPGSGTITLLLVKNPTGLNEVIRTLVDARIDLSAVLFALNDGIADGRDTSWIWDADIEPLISASRCGIVATGDRADEFALRWMYGGGSPESVTTIHDIEASLFDVLQRARTLTDHGHCYALVTYTAMLRMRESIAAQGWTQAFWERQSHAGTAS